MWVIIDRLWLIVGNIPTIKTIMTINKNIAADVEKLVQKYVSDAMQQGVDLDTLGPEQLKMIVQLDFLSS